ncbi:MAG: modification methylase [Treponema sp.]|nr:modification methylase [Treponema sp.]MCL2252104.1 modification methylase [Treponema sp.]
MIPQIGIDILKEFNISSGSMLDPYCGSGTSFICGLECGIKKMTGFDLNPLAVLISKAKFTKLKLKEIENSYILLRNNVFEIMKNEKLINKIDIPEITNIYFWFSENVIKNLSIIKYCIDEFEDERIKNIFLVPFSETVRECSYTRNNEFKLYRMKPEEILNFNPDVVSFYFKKLNDAIECYKTFYLPKLKSDVLINIYSESFIKERKGYDVVLTSPPYGDSRTTVAYGQFSALSNEWLGINNARKIDGMLMGGKSISELFIDNCISESIYKIEKTDRKRALEVSSFYNDLNDSIKNVSKFINKNGIVIYIVGNRTVKNVLLPTDQFIAEAFEKNGFEHILTYERALSNKAMPSRNSPTNIAGKTVNTMLYEYIVVCKNTG